MYTHTHTHPADTYSQTHTHMHVYTHKQKHTHTYTHARTQTPRHTFDTLIIYCCRRGSVTMCFSRSGQHHFRQFKLQYWSLYKMLFTVCPSNIMFHCAFVIILGSPLSAGGARIVRPCTSAHACRCADPARKPTRSHKLKNRHTHSNACMYAYTHIQTHA